MASFYINLNYFSQFSWSYVIIVKTIFKKVWNNMKEKVEFKGSVVLNPVPVVLITSKNKEGKENVFTVGWIGTVCTKPPMLSISIRPERLS